MLIETLVFIAVISFLIVTHEFGHFIVARLSSIDVEKFSIGFGPVIFKKKFKSTLFLICAIPLGGYVKLAGDNRSELKGKNYEFFSKPPGVRAKVIFAGPLFNYLFSFLILWILFVVGMPYLEAVVGGTVDDSPAYNAGLQEGDQILEINGREIDGWSQLQELVRSSKGSVDLLVLREGKTLEFRIDPKVEKLKDTFGREREFRIIGVTNAFKVKIAREDIFTAFVKGMKRLWELTAIIVKGFYFMIIGVVPVKESVAGPVELFRITTTVAREGFLAVLNFISVIGVSIALVNLFPIPVLDGGHLIFLLLEKVRRRPLSERTEDVVTKIGMAMIGLLLFFVFYNDITRIVSGN